jgi:quercetin dioxygenase-like cupin family protein
MKHLKLNEIESVLNKYSVKAKTLVNHDHATIKNLYLNPGQAIPDHKVPMDVTFFILTGNGQITIGGETVDVHQTPSCQSRLLKIVLYRF